MKQNYEREVLLSCFFLLCIPLNASTELKCDAVVEDIFSECSNPFSDKRWTKRIKEDFKVLSSRCAWFQESCKRETKSSSKETLRQKNFSSSKCDSRKERDICHKRYHATVIDLMPFSVVMFDTLEKMLEGCCSDCAKLCVTNCSKHMSKESTNIVFPILGRSTDKILFGYHFLPIMDVPSAYLVTKKPSKSQTTKNLVHACTHLWPLLTICLLLAFLSGFVAWMIENRQNADEFPKAFHVGLFEGFWWSFITMTTVGYGDKAPKTRAGRIFSVCWILVGITICSMFTASLTTEIVKATTPEQAVISGNKVGAMKHRHLDAAIIAKQGGTIMEFESDNIPNGIKSLINAMNANNISGFLVDRQTYYYFYSLIEEETKIDTSLRSSSMLRTEKFYDGEKLSFGILFRNRSEFNFFENYFIINRLQLEACNYFQMNAKVMMDKSPESYLFDPKGGLFYKFLWGAGISIGVIGLFGAAYEYRRCQTVTDPIDGDDPYEEGKEIEKEKDSSEILNLKI